MSAFTSSFTRGRKGKYVMLRWEKNLRVPDYVRIACLLAIACVLAVNHEGETNLRRLLHGNNDDNDDCYDDSNDYKAESSDDGGDNDKIHNGDEDVNHDAHVMTY